MPLVPGNPIDVYVGSRIRLRRLMLGMSQTKLADQLGVTFQQVQKYEKGANRVGASRLQHIADVLKVPISFFFENGGDADKESGLGEANDVAGFVSTKEGMELNRAFFAITDTKVRQSIVALTKSLAGSTGGTEDDQRRRSSGGDELHTDHARGTDA